MRIDFRGQIVKNAGYQALVTLPKVHKEGLLPTIIHLHSAGGFDSIRNCKLSESSILVEPISKRDIWDTDGVMVVIREAIKLYPIDPNRIAIAGHSMGGRGTLDFICDYPNIACCALSLSGMACYLRAFNIINVPLLAIHGRQDNIVEPIHIQRMVDSIKHLGKARLILLEGGHDASLWAYNSEHIKNWILEQNLLKR